MLVKFGTFNGIQTRYYEACASEAGKAHPLILIHGIGVTAEIWWRNIGPLSQRHRVFALDMLGSGFTEAGEYHGGPIHPYVIDHLAAFADSQGLESFSIAGSSIGALFATLLYLRMPERVKKLILISSGSMFNNDEEYLETWQRTYDNGRTVFENPSYEACRQRASRVVFDPAAIPSEMLVMQMSSYALPGALEMFEKRTVGMMDLDAVRPYRVLDRLEKISVPTLAIFGRNDPRANWQSAQEEICRMPSARLEVYDDCGHYPQLEHYQEFNRSVRAFLNS